MRSASSPLCQPSYRLVNVKKASHAHLDEMIGAIDILNKIMQRNVKFFIFPEDIAG